MSQATDLVCIYLTALQGVARGLDRDPARPCPGFVETTLANAAEELDASRVDLLALVDGREALFELENATVHALMHLGRVAVEDRDSSRIWAPQMAVYVKPRGSLGRIYMKLIQPFRHLIVYPALMRSAERSWPQYESRLAHAPHRQLE